VSQPTRIQNVVLVEDATEDARFVTAVVQEAFGAVSVQTARTLAKAAALLETCVPDLVVLDLNLPDGTGASLLPSIRARHAEVWVVVVTVFDDDEHLFYALQQGADGYLLKDESKTDAAALLREILEGRPPLSARVARRVLKFVQATAPDPKQKPRMPALTPREQEVLTLLASGHTAVSAAAQLGISEHTIKTHVKNLYKKLDVSSRASMVRAALDDGLR
jgi:DNA-binding NarL/FixJ family response regulator